MTDPLPNLHHHTPKLSVGLVPTEATTHSLLRYSHLPPISHSLRGDKPHGGEGESPAALGSWPVSAPPGRARRGRRPLRDDDVTNDTNDLMTIIRENNSHIAASSNSAPVGPAPTEP